MTPGWRAPGTFALCRALGFGQGGEPLPGSWAMARAGRVHGTYFVSFAIQSRYAALPASTASEITSGTS